jgi:DNA polymerase III subunit delta
MSRKVTDHKPVYLIYGTEELKLEQALVRLKNSVGQSADLDFNMDTFDGDSADADDIVAASNTLPFASERRLVIVRNVDKMNKEGLETLAAYSADPSPTTVLVLVAVKFAKNTRLFKAVDKLGGTHEYAAPRKSEYPKEVGALFEARGKRISRDAAELLVSSVGFDLRRLSAEVDKASAFVGDRQEVTLTDIEHVAATTAPTSVFEFVDAVADRDCRRALRLMSHLIGEGESVLGLNALVLRRLRDLIAVGSLEARGVPMAGIARELGRQEWQIKRMPRQAREFRSGELVDLLRAAAESEAQMKTSRDSRLVFERFVMRICGV